MGGGICIVISTQGNLEKSLRSLYSIMKLVKLISKFMKRKYQLSSFSLRRSPYRTEDKSGKGLSCLLTIFLGFTDKYIENLMNLLCEKPGKSEII